jgi:2-dehydro-3-deoxyphosphogluconate aldolase/(4S)-4-hydroxy-2-oxoglutarate aldolase
MPPPNADHPALQRIGQIRIVPVLAVDDVADAAPLGEALAAGGLPIAEVTFRTTAAEPSIRAMAKQPGLLVGAGTVLNADTAKRAVDAGAQFIVSPGFNPKTVRWCVEHGVPIIPGCSTPTDLEAALDHGVTLVKFFPAEALGGLKMLQAMSAPFAMFRFMPTGGITPQNVAEYLRFPKIVACGGSWIATKELLAAKNFAKIAELSREAAQIAKAL